MVSMAAMAEYEASVNAKFQSLSDQVQNALASALEKIDATIGEQFKEANDAFAAERTRVEQTILDTAQAVQRLSSGSVENLLEQIAGINAREETFKDLLSDIHSRTSAAYEQRFAVLTTTVENMRVSGQKLQDRMDEYQVRGDTGRQGAQQEPESGPNRKAARLQIPKVKEWAIELLKDKTTATSKDQGYAAWRENFERQIGGVWIGMERLLVMIRDEKKPMDRERYEEYIQDAQVHEEGSEWNPEDWTYRLVSTKISLILHHYTDSGIHKTLAEATDGCGFEEFRLLDQLLDPQSDDMNATMQQIVMSAASVKTKNVQEELTAVKEVQARIREWQRRCGFTEAMLNRDRDKRTAFNAQLQVYASMVFTHVITDSTKRHIQLSQNASEIKNSIEKIREAIEQLAKLEVGARPVKMDLSLMAQPGEEERWTEAEFNEYWGYYPEQPWPEEEQEHPAEAENPSLDAFNQKGKGKGGKGYGYGGKGKGGKGKNGSKGGKGKGKDGKNNWSGEWGKSGSTPWVERRKCNICDEVGHIAVNCPQKAKLKSLAGKPEVAAQAPSPGMASFCSLYQRPKRINCDGADGCGAECGNSLRTANANMSIKPLIAATLVHNRFQDMAEEGDADGDTAEAVEVDAGVGSELPPPSRTLAKKKRGRMTRLKRTSQKERRQEKEITVQKGDSSPSAEVTDEGVVVKSHIHGKGDDHVKREPKTESVAAQVKEDSSCMHDPGPENMPDLGDSEDEEDVPEYPSCFLSEKQRARRERRHQLEECERVRKGTEVCPKAEDSPSPRITDAGSRALEVTSRPVTGLTEGSSQSLTMAASGDRDEHDKRSPAEPKPTLRGHRSGMQPLLGNDCSRAASEPQHFECPDTILKVGDGLASASLCGLWAKQALMAVSDKPQWERVILTVDSGASDTVLPPSIARNVPLLHSNKVGIEYEVANGGVVVNLGEKKAQMKLQENDASSMIMSFQVVEVHKPLLAVSRLVEAGHDVRFNKADPHILLSTGAKIPMRNNMGTYEIEVWILNPGFTGPK